MSAIVLRLPFTAEGAKPCLGGGIKAKRFAGLADGKVVDTGHEPFSTEEGLGRLGETYVAFGHCPSHCHLYIMSGVADGSIVIKEGEDMGLIDEITHGEDDAQTHLIFPLMRHPCGEQRPDAPGVVGHKTVVAGEVERIGLHPRCSTGEEAFDLTQITLHRLRGLGPRQPTEHEGMEQAFFHQAGTGLGKVVFHSSTLQNLPRERAEVAHPDAQHAFHTGSNALCKLRISPFGKAIKMDRYGELVEKKHAAKNIG